MPNRSARGTLLAIAAILIAAPLARAQSTAPTLILQDLGKDAAPLDGLWQFHLGDDPSFASPTLDDATGHDGWEQLTANAPWGAQGHRSWVGYAWYRKHISITPAAGVSPDWSLLVPHIGDVYAIYWNGNLIATHGQFPPNPHWAWTGPDDIYPAGALSQGVLAIRVFLYPLGSYETGLQGGLYAPPLAGTLRAVSSVKTSRQYQWLVSHQFGFGVYSLEALLMLLSLLLWLRDRSQIVLLCTALFCASQVTLFVLVDMRAPFDFRVIQALDEPLQAIQDVSLSFLLLWLLDLRRIPRLVRWTIGFSVVNIAMQLLDASTCLLDWSNPHLTLFAQWCDAICTLIYTVTEAWPVVLVFFAIRKPLDLSRWLVAGFACIADLAFVVPITLTQGSRFTHWTIGATIRAPLFTIAGNSFDIQNLSNFGLLLAIIYAVYRYSREALTRKQSIEQELRSAQELLQVLIPEALPSVPGYALTSSYRPAQEVGGDFFQIMPVADGSYVIALGDVSGKGLRAAMAVSLIVGTLRTLVETDPSPASILAGLNRRLLNRLQGGFATCLVLHLDSSGRCTIANAGHPAPYLNGREVSFAGSLPLGVADGEIWQESQFQLQIEDFLVLYTDGLLEARNATGEIFSFQRLASLVADRPSAAEALEAAQAFGQEDDITVLTLTRLASGEKPTTELLSPILAPA